MDGDQPPKAESAPELFLGRYSIERLLGEGGLGQVALARDTRLKRMVGIKRMRPSIGNATPEQYQQLKERFVREAEAGARMGSHPNLVTVYDLVSDADEALYLILEYVPGGTLVDRIRHGTVGLADALRWTADAATGLQAAHDHGIVHRDIKPSNIFVAMDGRAQVADFGMAQIDDLSARARTTVGHPGTPLYMSPEQEQTTGYLRPATDQYSLGLVLFEMVTGHIYRRLGMNDVMAQLARQPSSVASLIQHMTAYMTENRYSSIGVVASEARAIHANLSGRSTFPAPRWDKGFQTLPLDGVTMRQPGSIYPPTLLGSPPPSPRYPDPTVFAAHPPPVPMAGISRRKLLISIGGLILTSTAAGGAILAMRKHQDALQATITPQATNVSFAPPPAAIPSTIAPTVRATTAPSNPIVTSLEFAHNFQNNRAVDITQMFKSTDSDLYAIITLDTTKGRPNVKVVWTVLNAIDTITKSSVVGKEFGQVEKDATSTLLYASVSRGSTPWPVGQYKADVFLNGTLSKTAQFTIIA